MITAADLTAEFASNPLGLATARPRLGWRLVTSARGERAGGWQILAARRPELLAEGKADLWDSGRKPQGVSPLVEYDGQPLASADRCYWKVRVFDEGGGAGGWSEAAWFEIALIDEKLWRAEWIGAPGGRVGKALHFRTTLDLERPVRSARAYVAGIGWYEFRVNGEKIGDRVLEPAQTDFSQRVLYSVYDVTANLRTGRNVVGALVGNGWYGLPKLNVQIEIEHDDGSRRTILTGRQRIGGQSWLMSDGPIIENSVFDGEVYDARLEKAGWDDPDGGAVVGGGGPGGWWNSMVVDPPGGRLVPQTLEPIKVIDTLRPRQMTEPRAGLFVFDSGQNLAGWARLAVEGPAGTTVTLRFAESLYEDGTVNQENLRAAKARDVYILKGEGSELFEPRFTYHGFRFVQVEGYPGRPTLDSLAIRVVRSAVAATGSFESSDDLVNRIERAIFWTETSNLHGVPTDCPQRDERMGWLNDMAARSEELVHNFNVSRLLPKWLDDIADAQDKDNGAISDTAPFRWGSRPADPVSVCYVLIPWLLYRHYGDKRVLERHFDGMKRWVDYLTSRAPGSIVEYSYYGDWAPPIAEGLEGSIGSSAVALRTPGELISTAHYHHAAMLLARIATIIGRAAEAAEYGALADRIATAFDQRFWDETAGGYGSNNQASNAAALYMGLVPEARKARTLASIVADVEAHGDHLTTGNLCTKYILEILADSGHVDLAWRLVTQTSYPSWGYMLGRGATTVWERWEEATGGGMNSHNHPMYASLGAWFYRRLGGIRLKDDAIGFSSVLIAPVVPSGVAWVRTAVETVRGRLASSWRSENGRLTLDVTLPAGSTGEIRIPKPAGGYRLSEGGRPAGAGTLPAGIASLRDDGDVISLAAGAGDYSFVIEPA